MNTTITQEALAKVASLSSMLEDFAKSISMQKINIQPIAMSNRDFYEDENDYPADYYEDMDAMIEGENDEPSYGCCTGCMDCLGLSWTDFV